MVKLSSFLDAFKRYKASELHLISDSGSKLLIRGELKDLNVTPLSQEVMVQLLEAVVPESKQSLLTDGKPFSFSFLDNKNNGYSATTSFESGAMKIVLKFEKPGQFDDLLDIFIDWGASDLHLSVGAPPKLRVNGELENLNMAELKSEDVKDLIYQILPDPKKQSLNERGGADFGFSYKDGNRFRVSIMKQRGNLGAVLRIIPNEILTFEQTGLNPKIKELLFRPRGLFLVTGPTGSGKSTTMASMVDFINKNRKGHILTIEEPIEFYHEHQQCVVNQREVGVDVLSFSEALRGALRQDPDIILVGEMRDFETIELAVTAAETGHLVFGTLHTTGAAQTIDRIIDVFPSGQQSQVRAQLANGLAAIVSQQLLKRRDKKGRIAAFEILVATDSIRSLIRDGKIHQIASFLQTGSKEGMNTLDDNLINLYEQGIINAEDLVDKCNNRKSIKAYLGISD